MAQVFELIQSVITDSMNRISNTLHLLNTGTDEEPVDVLDVWVTSCKDPYLAMLPGTYELDRVEARRIVDYGSTGPTPTIQTISEVGTAADSGQPLPDFAMCRGTLYTALSGRRYRGSLQVAGAGINDLDSANGDRWTNSAGQMRANVQTYLAAVQTTFPLSGTMQWAVFSRFIWKSQGLTGVPTDWAQPITAWHVQPEVRTRRGRSRAAR